MDIELLQSLAKSAGIGGIALGVLLLVVKYILAKVQPTRLNRAQTSALLNRTLLAAWSIAVLGLGTWAVGNLLTNRPAEVTANGGVATGRDLTGSDITINNSESHAAERSASEPSDQGGVTSHGGVAAGRDISGSNINIGKPSQPQKHR